MKYESPVSSSYDSTFYNSEGINERSHLINNIMSKRKYHKSNCDSTVRAIVTDPLGRKVILVGKHAFEWSIILEKEGRLVITTFPKREQAVDTFNKKYRNK